MKISFADKFTIEIENTDTNIKGTFRKLTKKEEADMKNKFKKEYKAIEDMGKLNKNAQREAMRSQLKTMAENEADKDKQSKLLEELWKFEDSIDTSKFSEEISKYRFDMSVESEQLKELIEIGENYGYAFLIEMINKAVEEEKGNDIPA